MNSATVFTCPKLYQCMYAGTAQATKTRKYLCLEVLLTAGWQPGMQILIQLCRSSSDLSHFESRSSYTFFKKGLKTFFIFLFLFIVRDKIVLRLTKKFFFNQVFYLIPVPIRYHFKFPKCKSDSGSGPMFFMNPDREESANRDRIRIRHPVNCSEKPQNSRHRYQLYLYPIQLDRKIHFSKLNSGY